MKKSESGLSTPLAMTVIFSLSVMALSFFMLSAAGEKLIKSYENETESLKEADKKIYEIEKMLQNLKDEEIDFSDNAKICSLISSVCDNRFTVSDASTGINRRFLSDKFLENRAIKNYARLCDEDEFSEYGWINVNTAGEDFVKNIQKDYSGKNVFPLVNSMPLYNIHFMSRDFLEAVLEYSGVKNASEKADFLKGNLSEEASVKEISVLLGINESDTFFGLVGTKTAFWKIEFETDMFFCTAVFAAVPKKESHRKIEKYVLVAKKTVKKGGIV